MKDTVKQVIIFENDLHSLTYHVRGDSDKTVQEGSGLTDTCRRPCHKEQGKDAENDAIAGLHCDRSLSVKEVRPLIGTYWNAPGFICKLAAHHLSCAYEHVLHCSNEISL